MPFVSVPDTEVKNVSGVATLARDIVREMSEAQGTREPLTHASIIAAADRQWLLWLEQLGVSAERIVKDAKVSVTRAQRKRLQAGGAPEVRERIRTALLKRDLQRKEPTEFGALEAQAMEWRALAASLRALAEPLAHDAPKVFTETLVQLRALVERLTAITSATSQAREAARQFDAIT